MKGNPRKIHLALEETTEFTVIINDTRVVNYDQLTLGVSLIMTINDTRVVNSDTQPGVTGTIFHPTALGKMVIFCKPTG